MVGLFAPRLVSSAAPPAIHAQKRNQDETLSVSEMWRLNPSSKKTTYVVYHRVCVCVCHARAHTHKHARAPRLRFLQPSSQQDFSFAHTQRSCLRFPQKRPPSCCKPTHRIHKTPPHAAGASKDIKFPPPPISANRNQLVPIVPRPNKRLLWEFRPLNTFPFLNRHQLAAQRTNPQSTSGGLGGLQ